MTRWKAFTAAALLVLPAVVSAGGKTMPPQLARARYVAIGYDTGDGVLDARSAVGRSDLAPGDADALEELRTLVGEWDRFVLTERADQADIVIAVRTARRAAFEIGGRVGHDDPGAVRGARGQAPTLGGEVSSPGNVLSVYDGSGQGTLVLWRERGHGDDFPRASFERFRKDVEKTAKP